MFTVAAGSPQEEEEGEEEGEREEEEGETKVMGCEGMKPVPRIV
jgi:hypothetical protein